MAKAGNICDYFQCYTSKRNTPYIKMYGFPFKDEQRCRTWIHNAGATHLLTCSPDDLKNKKICEKHFVAEDFTKPTKERLRNNAVPIKYDSNGNDKLIVKVPSRTYSGKTIIKPYDQRPSTSNADLIESYSSPSTSEWLVSITDLPARPTRTDLKRRLKFGDEDSQKKKLKRTLKSQSALLSNKRAQISKLKKKLKQKNFAIYSEVSMHAYKLLKPEPQTFIEMNLRHKLKSPWLPKEREFALWLYYSSPSTYRGFAQKGFKLPSLATIKRWIGRLRFLPGFNSDFLRQIKLKASTMDHRVTKCILCFDEMSIMKLLEYSQPLDIIEGYEDLGPMGRKCKYAKKAMVFMLRGLYCKWKLPFCYFLSSSGPNSNELQHLITQVLHKVKICNFRPVAIVSDQATSNVAAFKAFGVTKEQPYFSHEGQKIFVIYDVPHLMKSIRNNLLNGCYSVNGSTISFEDIRETYEIDKRSKGARTLMKITPAHMNPNAFQRMSCKLALQVFSHSMAAAIRTCIQTNQLQSKSAASTADFVDTVNKTFDVLNSRMRYSKNPYNSALSKQNTLGMKTLNTAKEMFGGLQKIDCKGNISRPPSIDGLILSINAILLLFDEEVEDDITYLLTSRLNQDVVENFFSCVRQRGGFNRNPSSRVFRTTFRLLTLSTLMQPPDTTNYEEDEDEMFHRHIEEFVNEPTSPNPTLPTTQGSPSSSRSSASSISTVAEGDIKLEDCATVYFAGYLAKKCLDKFSCSRCSTLLVLDAIELNDKKQLFLVQKTYDNKFESSVGLRSPTAMLSNIIQRSLKIVLKCVTSKPERCSLAEYIYNKVVNFVKAKLPHFNIDDDECGEHREFLLKLMIRTTIFKWCKWQSVHQVKETVHAKLRILKNA